MYVAVLIFPQKKTCKFTQYSNAYSLFNIIEFHISEYMFLSLKTRWKNKYNELKHDTWLDMFSNNTMPENTHIQRYSFWILKSINICNKSSNFHTFITLLIPATTFLSIQSCYLATLFLVLGIRPTTMAFALHTNQSTFRML